MIYRLGYTELVVTDLEKSLDFYVNVLGFIEAKREENRVFLRAVEEFDEYSLILKEGSKPIMNNFGLRVSSEEELDDIKNKHESIGLETEFIDDGRGKELKVITPCGHPVSFYRNMPQIDIYTEGDRGVHALPMRNTHRQPGIPPLRIDHINLRVPDVNKEESYWHSFDFSTSEYIEGVGDEKYAAWVRREPFTHDIALVNNEEPGMHHVAFIVDGVAGVVRTADLLADAGYRDSIEYGPGRHGVTNAFFLYIRDPDGHRIEIYYGDYKRDLDRKPIRWTQEDYEEKGRLWWGPHVPATFQEISPINKEWIKRKVK